MNRMTRSAGARLCAVSILAALAVTSLAACAGTPATFAPGVAGAATVPPATSAAAPAGAAAATSTVDDLRRLIDGHQLTELRTTYNATYGASLLFYADKLSYYVALFHGKEFWRAIQTDSYDEAEAVYRTFAEQTQKLAQVDIDAMRLAAGKRYTEQMLALNQQRLQNLQQDAEYQRRQARQVAEQQQQAQQQAVALTADLRNTSSQLEALKQRIRELESQQADPSLTLPPPGAPAAPAPASSAPPAPSP
ncbi:DUF2968 domain-containing protein [Fulvimonas soli]|uniref:DUF2968 family protein n=1 Tax=Fulvimonas soli TaxID=155197 RepID=A0A316I5W1_9GAMM|nr:DUF2968 domain-containing protein [Fulvimonas soli]PWK85857.1 hypothetical protein C7456_108153 [Fulvimonas soli]TNY27239.1 hypothetical protein BV497_04460 [Fulvimonas soli]